LANLIDDAIFPEFIQFVAEPAQAAVEEPTRAQEGVRELVKNDEEIAMNEIRRIIQEIGPDVQIYEARDPMDTTTRRGRWTFEARDNGNASDSK
jgi:hypothetical protein